MKFTVGNKEKHEISFDYDTMWGKVKILIDGKEHTSSHIMFVGHTPFSFQVGENEKHIVRIELENPLGFAFRGSDVKVYVDEQLVQQNHIGGNAFVLFAFILSLFFVLWFVLR